METDLIAKWEQIQQKTFLKWVNMHLGKRGRKIENLCNDFHDGVNLLYLLSAISDEPVPKHVANPKMKVHCIENINTALKFIADHNVKLAGVGATEIYDGNIKMTLGMVWCLILRFVVSGLSEEGLSAKEGLLLWCQRKTKGYNNVNVQNFSESFQDGLAFCALIHHHRPDLLEFDPLSPENKASNLDLAFDVAEKNLDIPRLLDVEDIVNMPRPDERSIITYVAQLYKVFSSLENIENAGKKVSKFLDIYKEVSDFIHDYERRTRSLLENVVSKNSELGSAGLADNYKGAKDLIIGFRTYRRTTKRQWVEEQGDLAALFTQIQAKLSTINRPPYVPPDGLSVQDVEGKFDNLAQAERARLSKINAKLREILNNMRQSFANLANAFYDKLIAVRAPLGNLKGTLQEQLDILRSNNSQLEQLGAALPEIQASEAACDAANIEENELTDHTYDDLHFDYEQSKKAFAKAIDAVESHIGVSDQTGIFPEQFSEYRKAFDHFDQDHNGKLNRLEFKSLMSSLGLVSLDFDGSDKAVENKFKQISSGGEFVTFEQLISYMSALNSDATSVDALKESFGVISGGREYVTDAELKISGLMPEQVKYLVENMPTGPYPGSYNYRAWLDRQS